MRKLLWGSVAMLMFGAASVYFAADYAAKHPNSFLGRARNGAATFALTGNPVAVLHQLRSTDSEELPCQMADKPCDADEAAPPVDNNPIHEAEEQNVEF